MCYVCEMLYMCAYVCIQCTQMCICTYVNTYMKTQYYYTFCHFSLFGDFIDLFIWKPGWGREREQCKSHVAFMDSPPVARVVWASGSQTLEILSSVPPLAPMCWGPKYSVRALVRNAGVTNFQLAACDCSVSLSRDNFCGQT